MDEDLGFLNPNELTNDLTTTSMSYSQGQTSNATIGAAPRFNQMSLIKTSVLSAMFIVSLIGNTATLIQMYRMRRRRSTINTLILHLAVADLIVTFFCFVTDAVWASTIQWYAGNVMCKLIKFAQVFGLYLSTYIIVIISIDRCYAVLDPMSKNKAPRRVRSMIVAAWTLSAVFSSPQAYIFSVMPGPYEEEFLQCVTHGAYTAKWQEQLYSCLTVTLMFVLPLTVMLIAYMLIFCTIAKKSKDMKRDDDCAADMLSRGPMRGQLFRKAKSKSLRMTAVIVVAFIVCWTPYYVLFITFTFMERGRSSGEDENEAHIKINHALEKAAMWIFFFGMANSMVNPLIYGAFHICGRRNSPNWHYKSQSWHPARPVECSYTMCPIKPDEAVLKPPSLTSTSQSLNVTLSAAHSTSCSCQSMDKFLEKRNRCVSTALDSTQICLQTKLI